MSIIGANGPVPRISKFSSAGELQNPHPENPVPLLFPLSMPLAANSYIGGHGWDGFVNTIFNASLGSTSALSEKHFQLSTALQFISETI